MAGHVCVVLIAVCFIVGVLPTTSTRVLAAVTKLQILDAAVLLTLKQSFSPGPAAPLASWTTTNSDCNTWRGVGCDTNGYVVALNLSSKGLAGTLPAEIQGLTHLETLDLSNNPLSGPIPFLNLSTLPNLVHLDLSLTYGFTGTFTSTPGPGFPKLEYLALRNNQLDGPLPASLGAIRTLTHLDLEAALSRGAPWGPIPSNLENLTSLQYLSLGLNGLTGPVSPMFGGMTQLQYLDLSSNYLMGDMTAALQQLSAITTLGYLNMSLQTTELGGPSALTGQVPSDMGANWANLTVLDLQGCGIQGRLTENIGNMRELQIMNLKDGQLSGGMPLAIINCSSLVQLLLANNSLSGTLPTGKINRLTRLLTLDLSYNNFSGPLPDFSCIAHGVQTLMFAGNSFRSLVPEPWGRALKNLSYIDVHSNYLYGRITTLIYLTKLTYLDLSHNQLSGPLPTGWQSRALRSGAATGQAAGLTVDLSDNYIWGSPNFTLGALVLHPSGGAAALSLNCFTNETLQRKAADCKAFCNAEPNGGCQGIQSCMILAPGSVPSCMTPVPANTSWPPAPAGAGLLPRPASAGSGVKAGLIASIVGGVLVAAALLAMLGCFLLVRRNRGLHPDPGDKSVDCEGEGGKGDGDGGRSIRQCRRMEMWEIQKATDKFSDRNRLKSGGFGTVYKGMAPDGTLWAVKRTHCITPQSLKDFENEVKIISKMSHRNLVELLGYCQDATEQILVYEYVPNGNLRQQLDRDPDFGGVPLTFDQRLEVAVGAARGIHYLHSFAKEPIIHRDIKPANLVLDQWLEVKVTDFGLSRALPAGPGGADSCESQQLSTRMTGTPGYLDPDFYRTFKVTTKSDVFSFGVVLFELITGRTAVMKDPDSLDSIALVRWAHPYLIDGNVADIVDRTMGRYSKEAMDLLSAVALLCVNPRGEHRPTMLQVVRRLEEAQGATLLLPPSSAMIAPADLWAGVIIPGLPSGDSECSGVGLSSLHSEHSEQGSGSSSGGSGNAVEAAALLPG